MKSYVVFLAFKAGELIALLPRRRTWNVRSFLEFKAGEIVALLPDQELGEERSGSGRHFWGCWPQKSRQRSGWISGKSTLASLSTIVSSQTPFTLDIPSTIVTSPWPFARNSFKKPRLSQIVQIQSNLQKSNANKLLFYKKQNVNSYLLSQRFLE